MGSRSLIAVAVIVIVKDIFIAVIFLFCLHTSTNIDNEWSVNMHKHPQAGMHACIHTLLYITKPNMTCHYTTLQNLQSNTKQ